MSDYRRCYVPGGRYFFTVVCWERRRFFSAPGRVELLRAAFRTVKARMPFRIDAIVVLPDHLHAIWALPRGDADFSSRWREVKKFVTRRAASSWPVWQPRFWEHCLRNDEDWRRHVDYIHYNPVKHGLCRSPAQWPYSSFGAAVRRGWYEPGWGVQVPESLHGMDLE